MTSVFEEMVCFAISCLPDVRTYDNITHPNRSHDKMTSGQIDRSSLTNDFEKGHDRSDQSWHFLWGEMPFSEFFTLGNFTPD